ncbi:MAG: hypothetical protein HDR84_00575 [Bacteroides sp.]|nr:hypothetical protein [Bacteroides sp.]
MSFVKPDVARHVPTLVRYCVDVCGVPRPYTRPVMNRNERPVKRRCLRCVTSIPSSGNVGVNMGLRNWDFFAKFVG